MIELFSKVRSPNYQCIDFVIDAWFEITSIKLDRLQPCFGLSLISEIKSPCVVVFKNKDRLHKHIGIHIDGKIMHLAASVQYVDMDFVIGYSDVEYLA